jgi:predicted nucleic acid-binding protein
VVLDTDVASAVLRRRASTTLARQLAGTTLAITFVTVGELTNGHEGRPDVLVEGRTGVTRFLGALESTFAGTPIAAVTHLTWRYK